LKPDDLTSFLCTLITFVNRQVKRNCQYLNLIMYKSTKS